MDGGPFTAPTWLRALGLAACKGWPQPATPDPVVPPGAALSGAPALVVAGELGVGAPTATLRKAAGLFPSGTYVRVRGAAASPALNDPSGCAGALARAFLEKRGKVSPGCASRPPRPSGVTAFPATLAAAPAALRDAKAHGRDRSTLADRRAATAAALGVADVLADAEAGGAPTSVTGLRGGSATVTPRPAGLTLTLRGLRFVRDAALDGLVTHDSDRQRLRSALDARSRRFDARVRAHLEHEAGGGLAAARGSAGGRCCSCSRCPETDPLDQP